MMPVLSSENLCRRFGQVRAVEGVTLNTAGGEILALAGPNGSGKTTLLRLLAGLLEPTSGRVSILGGHPRDQGQRGEIGYVGDGWDLPPWMTVELIAQLQAGASRSFDPLTFWSLCESRKILPSSRYSRLSKGNRKWVLFSLAYATRQKVMLLDEPADGLDPVARRELYGLIRKCALGQGRSIIVSTHMLTDVERFADTVAILDRGRLLLHAQLEDLREEIRLVELPADAVVELPADAIEVLRATTVGSRQLLWLRCSAEDLEYLTTQLGPEAVVRTVDLESLFVALFEHERPVVEIP